MGILIVVIMFLIIWGWLMYELYYAPLMPEDFEIKDEDIWPLDERPKIDEDE